MEKIILIAAIVLTVILFKRHNARYGAVDNIRGPKSQGFWLGNLAQMYAPNSWKFHEDLESKYASIIKLHGMLGVYVFDPKAVHQILKDSDTYQATRLFIQGNRMLFGMGLLSTVGDHHKAQRKMINPVFSAENLRLMLPIFYDIAHELKNILENTVAGGEQEVNILGWMNRTALEIIGQAGLGYSFKSLQDGPPNPYSQAISKLIPTIFSMFTVRQCLVGVLELGPAKVRRILVRLIPWPKLQRLCKMVDIMDETTMEVYVAKKRALANDTISEHIGNGRDIMTILRKTPRLLRPINYPKKISWVKCPIDTTSGALSRILHLLAQHQDVQSKLRAEIGNARLRAGGNLQYEELIGLPYLDAVCRETLRVYPPLPFTTRTYGNFLKNSPGIDCHHSTRKDTVLPLSAPITGKDGCRMTEIFIPGNTNIVIGIMASNRNPDIWGADAAVWNPDRWSQLPDTVVKGHLPGVYSHMLTFLGGGKGCIGFKFSEMEIKAVLSNLLESLHFSLSDAEINWYLSGVQKPGIDGRDGYCLPLKVAVI